MPRLKFLLFIKTALKESCCSNVIENEQEPLELLFNSNANGWWLHFTVISDKMAFSLYRYFPLNAFDLLEILRTRDRINLNLVMGSNKHLKAVEKFCVRIFTIYNS